MKRLYSTHPLVSVQLLRDTLTTLLEHVYYKNEQTESTAIHTRQSPLDREKEDALRDFVDKLVAQGRRESLISSI
jgi:hypothetical protein